MRIAALATAILFPYAAGATESRVCGECHAAIYRNYMATAMARTSGMVDAITAPPSRRTEFTDAATATHFRVTRKQNGTFIHFAQGGAEGERRLDYFVGAGELGRSYASSISGYLFQSPVSYYTSTADWDLSPGYDGSDRLTLTRPVEPACLDCHSSGLRAAAGTVNGYQSPAFAEAGVSCERCHGPGEAHVARMKSSDIRRGSGIVNPARLNPAERDSICAQCHLVGVIRVAMYVRASAQSGTGRYEPGKRLFDASAAFLWSSGAHTLSSNSHFEQLASSGCWKGSAGKLWCGSCHSPHNVIAREDRADFYRRRCLACHAAGTRGCSAPPAQRTSARDDCVACHMPARAISTVAHAAQVDHTISRSPRPAPESPAPESPGIIDASLVPFPGSSAGDRELGLAYATEALPRNNRAWGERAFQLLKKVAATHPDDPAVELQLAQLYDRMGQEETACNLFQQAVRNDVPGTAALVNLGTCQAKRGDIQGAMKLWSQALERNPALEAARLNLAIAQSQSGEVENARQSLQTALQFDPFSRRVSELLRSLAAK